MSTNINGGSRGRAALSSVDFYRRVPRDLTEATTLGAVMSICAISVMAILFFSETFAFARTTLTTAIALDENAQEQIRLNFNITFMDLHCDYVSVDVWDAIGTNRQNVTKDIEKWQLDENGARRIFSGRNRDVRELSHEEHEETLEELHEDGVHAVPLTGETFKHFIESNDIVFVDMYAPWCIWCQRLHPTWEKFAEEVEKEGLPMKVATVDCVAQSKLCQEWNVRAFPTLRWFSKGAAVPPDYKMDRTIAALMGYARRKLQLENMNRQLESSDEEKGWAARARAGRPEFPGCQVSGHLLVNRVPGNFHVEAKSKNHNLNAAMTNLTHKVNHLSFGEPDFAKNRKVKRVLKQVPEAHQQFTPMDDTVYPTFKFHQAFHHYIKVVSTHFDMGNAFDIPVAYQFLEQSQIVYYDEVNVPEARFSYDLSPMSVVVQRQGRKWYDYVTSLCAIIGGTFTTLGLIDATLYRIFKAKKL